MRGGSGAARAPFRGSRGTGPSGEPVSTLPPPVPPEKLRFASDSCPEEFPIHAPGPGPSPLESGGCGEEKQRARLFAGASPAPPGRRGAALWLEGGHRKQRGAAAGPLPAGGGALAARRPRLQAHREAATEGSGRRLDGLRRRELRGPAAVIVHNRLKGGKKGGRKVKRRGVVYISLGTDAGPTAARGRSPVASPRRKLAPGGAHLAHRRAGASGGQAQDASAQGGAFDGPWRRELPRGRGGGAPYYAAGGFWSVGHGPRRLSGRARAVKWRTRDYFSNGSKHQLSFTFQVVFTITSEPLPESSISPLRVLPLRVSH